MGLHMYFYDKPRLSYLGAPRWHTLPSLLSELDVGMCQPFPPSANTLCFHKKNHMPACMTKSAKEGKRGQVAREAKRQRRCRLRHLSESGTHKILWVYSDSWTTFLDFLCGAWIKYPSEEHKYFWRFQWEAESTPKTFVNNRHTESNREMMYFMEILIPTSLVLVLRRCFSGTCTSFHISTTQKSQQSNHTWNFTTPVAYFLVVMS